MGTVPRPGDVAGGLTVDPPPPLAGGMLPGLPPPNDSSSSCGVPVEGGGTDGVAGNESLSGAADVGGGRGRRRLLRDRRQREGLAGGRRDSLRGDEYRRLVA